MAAEYQKFAVILACNYYGDYRLYGCINDAINIRDFLVKRRKFDDENIVTVFDDKMTKKGIWSALDDIVLKAEVTATQGKIPAFFLYYSGHGTRLDYNKGDGDRDGNEALIPYDFLRNGYVIDDDLNKNFLARLPPSTEIFIFTDCCNSGTNFDVPYVISATRSMDRSVNAKVISLSGCRDDQTSAEVAGQGVATRKFLDIIDKVETPQDLAAKMADLSIWSHPQNPQVSISNLDLGKQSLFSWIRVPMDDSINAKTFKKMTSKAKASRFFSKLLPFGGKFFHSK